MSTNLVFQGGPAFFAHGGHTVQMADAWQIASAPTHFEVTTDLRGTVDLREDDTIARLTSTPLQLSGTDAIRSLYPYQPSMLGSLVFPPTDRTLVVQTTTGRSLTFARAALTKMPSMTFAGHQIFFGPAEWTMLRLADIPATTAGAMYTVASSAYIEPTLDAALILSSAATLNVGTLAAVQTDENGVTFTPTLTLIPRKTSKHGVCNYEIAAVGATVAFTPEDLTEADLYDALQPLEGAGTGRGTSLAGIGGAVTVTSVVSGGPVLTVPLAAPTQSSLRFDARTGRVGRVTMQALCARSIGALRPLFTVA